MALCPSVAIRSDSWTSVLPQLGVRAYLMLTCRTSMQPALLEALHRFSQHGLKSKSLLPTPLAGLGHHYFSPLLTNAKEIKV